MGTEHAAEALALVDKHVEAFSKRTDPSGRAIHAELVRFREILDGGLPKPQAYAMAGTVLGRIKSMLKGDRLMGGKNRPR